MARKTKTNLTFQVTLPAVQGVSIKYAREYLMRVITDDHEVRGSNPFFDPAKVKIHLTNKETSYA